MRKVTVSISRALQAALLLLFLAAGSVAAGAPMDLTKALKTGSGKTVVIEFTDPDCPFCRKGAAFFRNRTDVTRYIFFNPLPMHPQAKDKARFILSSPDRAAAYEEVMSGRLDGRQLTGITAAGTKLLEEQMAIAQETRVDSTPIFIICGRIIQGFDQHRIEGMLGK
jgi:thiol:disulfide interchange protein DsbC